MCPGTCGSQLEIEWIVVLADATCSRAPVVAAEVPGLAIVAGGVDLDPVGSEPWVAGVEPDGCVAWIDSERRAESIGQSRVLGVAGDERHGYYAVGRLVEPVDGDLPRSAAWIRRYEPDGDIAWTVRERAAASQVASSVAIDLDGGAIVVGGTAGATGSRGWVRRYSPEGAPRGSGLLLADGPASHILDVAVADDGRAWVSAWIGRSSSTRAWVAGLEPDDQVAWIAPSSHPGADAARLLLLPDSSLMLIERASPPRLSLWSADGDPLSFHDLQSVWSAEPSRADRTREGTIVVAGSLGPPGPDRPVVLLVDPVDGLLGVQRIPGVERGTASDVSVAPDGSIYIAGLVEDVGGETRDCDTWLVKARL